MFVFVYNNLITESLGLKRFWFPLDQSEPSYSNLITCQAHLPAAAPQGWPTPVRSPSHLGGPPPRRWPARPPELADPEPPQPTCGPAGPPPPRRSPGWSYLEHRWGWALADRDWFWSLAQVLTCCGAAIRFEGGSEFGESSQRGSGSDALVFAHSHLTLSAAVVQEPDGDRNDLRVEPTRLLSLGRPVWGQRNVRTIWWIGFYWVWSEEQKGFK